MGVQALTYRIEIPNGRDGARVPVEFVYPGGEKSYRMVTFNFGDGGRIIECFLAHDELPESKGGQLCELLEDGCKLLSRCLQYGDTIHDLAKYCGENVPEGEKSGTPSSIIGAIARTGAQLEAALKP